MKSVGKNQRKNITVFRCLRMQTIRMPTKRSEIHEKHKKHLELFNN